MCQWCSQSTILNNTLQCYKWNPCFVAVSSGLVVVLWFQYELPTRTAMLRWMGVGSGVGTWRIRNVSKLGIHWFRILPYCDTTVHAWKHQKVNNDLDFSVVRAKATEPNTNPRYKVYKFINAWSSSTHAIAKNEVRFEYNHNLGP